MKAIKRLFVTLFFLSSAYALSAQVRLGVRVGYPVVPAYKYALTYDKFVQSPSYGIYYQKWTSDRTFQYAELYYESAYTEEVTFGYPAAETNRIRNLALHWSWAKYLRHREFEDNFAWYWSYGAGLGVTQLSSVTYKFDNTFGHDAMVQEDTYLPYFCIADLAIGVEKRLAHRYFLNSSLHLNVGLYPYAGIVLRFTRSMY